MSQNQVMMNIVGCGGGRRTGEVSEVAGCRVQLGKISQLFGHCHVEPVGIKRPQKSRKME